MQLFKIFQDRIMSLTYRMSKAPCVSMYVVIVVNDVGGLEEVRFKGPKKYYEKARRLAEKMCLYQEENQGKTDYWSNCSMYDPRPGDE